MAKVALFRDVKAADALRGASPKIRRIFMDAGFGLGTSDARVPTGFYSSGTVAERNRILRNVFENMRSRGLKGEYCGEFDFWRFLENAKTARPLREAERRPMPQMAQSVSRPTTKTRRTVPGRIGFSLGLAVILFVVLKYLADTGSMP